MYNVQEIALTLRPEALASCSDTKLGKGSARGAEPEPSPLSYPNSNCIQCSSGYSAPVVCSSHGLMVHSAETACNIAICRFERASCSRVAGMLALQGFGPS